MKHLFRSEVGMLYEHVMQYLEDWITLHPRPLHKEFLEKWKADIWNHLESICPDDEDLEVVEGILDAYSEWAIEIPQRKETTNLSQLLDRPQTNQRTTDWYNEFQKCLTASELYKLFGSQRERAVLVIQKSGILENSGHSTKTASLREKMSPFDWGICFEPVVKQILEKKWAATIHDCGRFVHQTDTRLAASPDGIITACKMPDLVGHLLEIKCPKSRDIGKKIPTEYYYQMQLQLEVTDVSACEYVEARFEFLSAETSVTDRSEFSGNLAVIGAYHDVVGEILPTRYMYGPIGDFTWNPLLETGETLLELNTWKLVKLHHERVFRDQQWFSTLVPKIDEFWNDVEKARAGQFSVPESSRKKPVVCQIVESESETL